MCPPIRWGMPAHPRTLGSFVTGPTDGNAAKCHGRGAEECWRSLGGTWLKQAGAGKVTTFPPSGIVYAVACVVQSDGGRAPSKSLKDLLISLLYRQGGRAKGGGKR